MRVNNILQVTRRKSGSAGIWTCDLHETNAEMKFQSTKCVMPVYIHFIWCCFQFLCWSVSHVAWKYKAWKALNTKVGQVESIVEKIDQVDRRNTKPIVALDLINYYTLSTLLGVKNATVSSDSITKNNYKTRFKGWWKVTVMLSLVSLVEQKVVPRALTTAMLYWRRITPWVVAWEHINGSKVIDTRIDSADNRCCESSNKHLKEKVPMYMSSMVVARL